MDKEETWDLVVYEKDTKEIITVVQDIPVEPKFLINLDYVAAYIPHNEYMIETGDDGKGYFKSLNNIKYLDDYRGRYID